MLNPPAGRLLPSAVQQLRERKQWPTRDPFLRHVRRTVGQWYSAHWWVKVRAGEPVPLPLLECLHRYLRDERRRLPWVGEFAAFAEAVDGTARLDPTGERKADAWRYGWVKLLGLLPTWPSLPQEAFASAADIPAVARMVMADLGRRHGHPPVDALREGERLMGRPADAYAGWLLGFWRKHPETVLFATVGDPQRGYTRAGVSITLPLAEDAYRRVSAGRLDPLDLRPADCPRVSHWLHPHAIAESDPRPDGTLSRSLLQCAVWQAALFVPRVRDVMRGVTAVCVDIHPENTARAKRYGYRPAGRSALGMPLLELRPPGDWPERPPLAERCGYAALCAVLRILQEVQAADRERLRRSGRAGTARRDRRAQTA